MKKLILAFGLILSMGANAHPVDEPRVVIEPLGTGHYLAGEIQYDFQLFDTVAKKPIAEIDLNESHTKKLHFISYDAALQEFSHVHPTFNGKIWHVTLQLPVNGKYFFWAQGELADKTEFSTFVDAMVMNGKPENQVIPVGDIRQAVDRSTQVELDKTTIKAGQMTMINFKISRTDGIDPVITPYLGEFAHLIATPADGDELTHVHPMAGGKPNTGMIHATFEKEGDYRIWVQLMDHAELKTIALSVTVLK